MSASRLSRRGLLGAAGGWGAGSLLTMTAQGLSAEAPKIRLSTPQAEKLGWQLSCARSIG